MYHNLATGGISTMTLKALHSDQIEEAYQNYLSYEPMDSGDDFPETFAPFKFTKKHSVYLDIDFADEHEKYLGNFRAYGLSKNSETDFHERSSSPKDRYWVTRVDNTKEFGGGGMSRLFTEGMPKEDTPTEDTGLLSKIDELKYYCK